MFYLILFYFIFNFLSLAPGVGPDNVVTSKLNESTFNISWTPLARDKSYGNVIQYEVNGELVSRGMRTKRATASKIILNSTETFAVLFEMKLCSQYKLSVRAYTSAGPGPYSKALVLQTAS